MNAHLPIVLALAAAVPVAGPAIAGEVTASTETSFTVTEKAVIAAPPARVWTVLIAPSAWWSGEHSWSGSAANLSLDPRPGGCWCEKLPDGGGVEHMRVILVRPGRMLRLSGGLGPLQAFPAGAVMTVTLDPAADGKSTTVSVEYAVAGAPGLGRIAAPVDGVLAAQVIRLKAAAER
ncbi:SRPBCC domain-containing protein [Sphingomonas sp. CBMAI 2297]|uniref:SRPBCC family protein n=1 Tax=Sphingomonas sp. CBMAI 2297 TaxID=2991720 RepID=UPI0024587D84|nr:SRPBCC domain-containing protein [Sphingomonas sp. CBMAI 2297]MDH4745286.1 SRPBCC domain-containing protein [Sphingomonas sp. CBMAI 2297]